ncbi:hypothetical protein AB0D63_43375 [Kitasatospora sp. NPDC048343]|uniref:hypothetical protein n=1 Tax=Kitasatospora sp. NPDC048343 TaxID=3154717 RepID=UPI0033FDB031
MSTIGAVVVGIAVGVLLYSAGTILSLELKSRTGHGQHRLGHRPPTTQTVKRVADLQAAAVRDYMGHQGQATVTPEVHPTRAPITYSPVCWTACGTDATGGDHARICLNYRKDRQ